MQVLIKRANIVESIHNVKFLVKNKLFALPPHLGKLRFQTFYILFSLSSQAFKRSGVKRCANQQALNMIPIIDGHRLRAAVVCKQIEDR